MIFSIKTLALIILLAPLGASLIIGLCNKRLSKNSAHRLALVSMTLSLMSSLYLLKMFYHDESGVSIPLYTWAESKGFDLSVGLLIDRLSVMMISMVTLIAWLVHLYSIAYMAEDSGYQRFFCYIAFFTFSMLVLVMSNNFLQLFFGWEMVGLASYLLIGFWFHKETAVFAGLKAFIINRIGDCGFLMGIAGIGYGCGSLDYAIVFQQVQMGVLQLQHPFMPTFICLGLLMGAMAKSAQIPLHVWLPDSMEGPTPISALIHAATMVTAGVFMIARLSVLFECSSLALNALLMMGSLTCILMGLVALVQNDIKRIIAYSTLSQLGYMMMAMGASAYTAGIFHLFTHACFKALLFLAAGSIIMRVDHEQDIWKIGPLHFSMPITYSTMLIASLALIGVPFFSGFYSKDLIVEGLRLSTQGLAPMAYRCALLGVLITTLYTFRLFFVVFHRKTLVAPNPPVYESSWIITLPLMVLAFFSLVLGIFGLSFFEKSISHSMDALRMGFHGFYQIPFIFNVLGMLICYLCYRRYPVLPVIMRKRFAIVYSILCKKYGFDTLYNRLFEQLKQLGARCFDGLEQHWIDGITINGSAAAIQQLSLMMRRLQSGYIYHYVFIMIVTFILLVGFCLFLSPFNLQG
ncbi:MAG: NADH-quinone oxidoreductase subunit L [Gammaproteobacteria bacterium]|nr:NADH-quinone oxidoreductase subunit L [Gammaproteobacteria bacterium]MBP9728703.1 NADH-quinone oxidoreductase subunit L [Gammaproteobacteria bacterium]